MSDVSMGAVLSRIAVLALDALPPAEARNAVANLARIHGVEVKERVAADAPWVGVQAALDAGKEFSEIRLAVEMRKDQMLSPGRICGPVAACLGYALKQVVRGEELSPPDNVHQDGTTVTFECSYDFTRAASDDPDLAMAFELARRYIREGTPVRSTDRAGAGTKGTRLLEGLPGLANLTIWVR